MALDCRSHGGSNRISDSAGPEDRSLNTSKGMIAGFRLNRVARMGTMAASGPVTGKCRFNGSQQSQDTAQRQARARLVILGLWDNHVVLW